jgi:hypothetical protein
MPIEQRTYLGERGELNDGRNDQRSRQQPRPIRTRHIGPNTLLLPGHFNISTRHLAGHDSDQNLLACRDLTILPPVLC